MKLLLLNAQKVTKTIYYGGWDSSFIKNRGRLKLTKTKDKHL